MTSKPSRNASAKTPCDNLATIRARDAVWRRFAALAEACRQHAIHGVGMNRQGRELKRLLDALLEADMEAIIDRLLTVRDRKTPIGQRFFQFRLVATFCDRRPDRMSPDTLQAFRKVWGRLAKGQLVESSKRQRRSRSNGAKR